MFINTSNPILLPEGWVYLFVAMIGIDLLALQSLKQRIHESSQTSHYVGVDLYSQSKLTPNIPSISHPSPANASLNLLVFFYLLCQIK